MAKINRLYIITAIWIAIMVFSPLRPDPQAQVRLGQGMTWFYQQAVLLLMPYAAMSALFLNIKLKYIKQSWFIKTLPFVMGLFLLLDLFNNLVEPISSNGSFLTMGFVYLSALIVAHLNSEKSYFSGLCYGVVVSSAAVYIWEAIYQLVIYSKLSFVCEDNITFFMSALYTIPFVAILLIKKCRLNKRLVIISLLVFLASFAVWGCAGFNTGVNYIDGKWVYQSVDLHLIDYWEYALTRINKIAFGLMTAGFILKEEKFNG